MLVEDIPPDETRLAGRAGEELAARLASEFWGVRRVGVRRVAGRGVVNQVFVAEGGGRSIVVRLCDGPYALKQHEKEAWCFARAREAGVLGPEVFAVGTADGGAAYMIESFVAGAAGDELPAKDKLRVWRALGEYARAIHAVELDGFGINLPDFTGGDARGGWLRYVDYNIESLNERDELLRLEVLTWEQSARVRSIFEELRGREFCFGLNHGDLSLKNTIVDDDGRVHLLDWGSAAADVAPHLDLLQLLRQQMLKDDPNEEALAVFLEGYGMSRKEYDALLPELESVLLLRSFDLVRFAIDRCPDHIRFYAQRARLALARKLRHV